MFEHGAAEAHPGGLWALDMRKGGGEKPVRLEIYFDQREI